MVVKSLPSNAFFRFDIRVISFAEQRLIEHDVNEVDVIARVGDEVA
jgi:hypothetical protein